jgi:hypothetical protein
MPVALVLIIGLGALFHLALGRWVASPWLVPDLTLVSVISAMARAPEYSMNLVLLGGCLAIALAPSQCWWAGFAFAAAGGLVILLGLRWDLDVPLTQLLATGAAEAMLLVLAGCAGIRVTPGLVVLSGIKTLITVCCLLLVQPFSKRC